MNHAKGILILSSVSSKILLKISPLMFRWEFCKTFGIDKLSNFKLYVTEAFAQRCSVKKLFLEISQNSQENTCARASFLIKLQAPATLLKKRLWCFPVNFAKFLRTHFLAEHLRWLFLRLQLPLCS